VPQESGAAWLAAFAERTPGVDVPGLCPLCDAEALHRYFHLYRREETVVDSEHFLGRGGLWEWCSACRRYIHYSARVPTWWSSDLTVDPRLLSHAPESIEQARRARRET
jgi:hypothetical protein